MVRHKNIVREGSLILLLFLLMMSLFFLFKKNQTLHAITTLPLLYGEFTQDGHVVYYEEPLNRFSKAQVERDRLIIKSTVQREGSELVRSIRWSLTGERIAIQTSKQTELYAYTDPSVILNNAIEAFAWSPDEDRLIYQTRPNENNQSEVRVYQFSTGSDKLFTPIDLSDRLFTNGFVTLLWPTDALILYAPETTDAGGDWYWVLKNGVEHMEEGPSVFSELFGVSFSPKRTWALVEMLSPAIEEEETVLAFIDLHTLELHPTSLSAQTSFCRWMDEWNLVCLTRMDHQTVQFGMISLQQKPYEPLLITKTFSFAEIKDFFYDPDTSTLFLLFNSRNGLYALDIK